MTMRALAFVLFAAYILPIAAAAQQAVPNAQAPPYNRERLRSELNDNALLLMGGPLGQSDIAYAADIASIVDDGINFRVLPVVGAAAAQNVKDVLFLRGVDLAITDSATLATLQRTNEAGPRLERQITYISVLYSQEIHVLARGGIKSIKDLSGKRVNFDIAGSGSALHLPALFQKLGIETQNSHLTQADAVERMRRGELDATACICAKPVAVFQGLGADTGFTFLDVSFADAPEGEFLPSSITGSDYPGLMAPQSTVETIATTAVLISFNWPASSPRYKRMTKFVDAFFSKFPNLQEAPRQPGWQTVNLAATMPGWQRFAPAEEWLEKNHRSHGVAVKREFARFAAERGIRGDDANPMRNDALFREFLEWKSKAAN